MLLGCLLLGSPNTCYASFVGCCLLPASWLAGKIPPQNMSCSTTSNTNVMMSATSYGGCGGGAFWF